MCGIAGIISAHPSGELGRIGEALLRRLEHRGPDDHGWLSYGSAGVRRGQGRPDADPAEVLLLHRRLSILDLSSAGHQPMSSPDGRYHLTFNGEIYNYRELRRELENAGRSFRTHTDTEVLLAALADWGRAALPRLVGMFGFALLDTVARTVLLARDFFGIKPLYYTRSARRLAFASEIKALLELPDLARRIDPAALHDYLVSGITDHGSRTMLADVEQLLPGHCLEIRLDEPHQGTAEPYWRIAADRTADISFSEAAARLRELFLESIELHLRADVPVGACLSGGLDSSAIVCAVRHVAGPRAELHTFSYIAEDPRYNEQRWVDLVSRAANTHVHKVRIRAEEVCEDLDQLIVSQDEPFGGTSICVQYRVFRLAREAGIKVLLDGQGSDELLAGYQGFLHARIAGLVRGGEWKRALRFARKAALLRGAGMRGLAAAAVLAYAPAAVSRAVRRIHAGTRRDDWIRRDWFLARGVRRDAEEAGWPVPSLRGALLETMTRTSLPMLLRYEDRNSMAHSVESRVPFLTPELAQFVFSLPEHYLIDDSGTSKSVLRAAMRGIVPDAVLDRTDKISFETPEADWLKASAHWAREVLHSEVARSIGAWHADRVQEQGERMLAGGTKLDGRLWRWLNLIRWTELLGVGYD